MDTLKVDDQDYLVGKEIDFVVNGTKKPVF